MDKSDSIKELATALNKVQANLQAAKKGNENPYFHSKYADLLSIWEACREVLTTNGLSVVQVGALDEQGNAYLETMLLHSSGEWIMGKLPLRTTKADPQSQGSAITYARRYSLSSIIGLCTEEDDDAEAAMERKKPAPKAQTKPQPNPQQGERESITEPQAKAINTLLSKAGVVGDFERHKKVAEILNLETIPSSIGNLNKSQASTVIEALNMFRTAAGGT
ncbi:MAG TPA: ERF family protein [Dehalococcoidia bacterium]|nr:ERF family protein [Dehalococcoidia bacterium]